MIAVILIVFAFSVVSILSGVWFGRFVYQQLVTGNKTWMVAAAVLCGLALATGIMNWIVEILTFLERTSR